MSDIKVRFAPSPTGWMHIGNTRTAVFNWLLAKKLGGKFLLRIDDTDVVRSKKEYEDAIRDVLVWLGLNWDEEARQSARTARYDKVVAQLKSQGRIYACYETAEELEVMRKKLMTQGKPPIYDRGALRLTKEDIARYEAEGRKPHYRFKLNEGVIAWDDLVRGHIQYNAANLADPVIIREDGSYLYHLPSVIDDFDFSITHIVRGEDHVTNTAAQIQMFEALGGKAPQFAHLPLLTGKEGKLSKRLGSLGVRELRAMGIENMAICAFLAKLGTSEVIEPWDNLDDLAQSLDFSKLGRSQPKFDEEDLRLFNHKVVHQLKYSHIKDRLNVSEEFWEAIKGNLDTVAEASVWQDVCFAEVSPVIEDKDLCATAAEVLPNDLTTDDAYNNWVNAIKQKTGKKGKDLFHPLRMALSGLENGPELKVLLKFIGYTKAKARLNGQKA